MAIAEIEATAMAMAMGVLRRKRTASRTRRIVALIIYRQCWNGQAILSTGRYHSAVKRPRH